jgi:hypothetical protein
MRKVILYFSMIFFCVTAPNLMAQQDAAAPHGHAQGQQSDSFRPGQAVMPPWMHNQPKEKQEAFKKIHETRAKTIYPLMMQLKAQKAQLMAELAQATVNRKAVDQILSQMNDLHSKISREQLDLLLELKTQFPEGLMHGMMMGDSMGMMGSGMGMMGPGMGMGMMGGAQGAGGCPMMGGGMGGGMMGGRK